MNVCMSVNHGRLNVKRDILKIKRTKERMIVYFFHVCGKVKNIKATPIVSNKFSSPLPTLKQLLG